VGESLGVCRIEIERGPPPPQVCRYSGEARMESMEKALFKRFTGDAKEYNPWKIKIRSWLCIKKALSAYSWPEAY
jgi:hypothetical protein